MERTRRLLFKNISMLSGAVILQTATPTPTPEVPTATPTPPASNPEEVPTATPTPPEPEPEPTKPPLPLTRSQIETMIREKTLQAGLDPNRMSRAVACESTFNPRAVSKNGLYHGLLQYDKRTWGEALAEYQRVNRLSNEELANLGLDVYNPVHHIEVSIPFIRKVGYSRWPNC